MFEVGKLYEIEVVEPNGERSFIRGEILAREGVLIELNVSGRPRTFNTTASTFVGARECRVPGPGSRVLPFPPPKRAD